MSQLNGAYYGPSIPPPPKSQRRSSRCGGCCCLGGCLSCCCGCIFDLIFSIICKLIMTVLVLVAIAAFLFWLIVRPNVVKVHVTNATLTQFNFTDNTTLHYNLVLNMTIRNPNRRVGIYYDYIEVSALYHDAAFANQTLPPFFQHKKNTTVLGTVLKGEEVLVLGSGKGSKVEEEKGSGVFGVDLKFDMKVRFKLGLFKTGKIKPKVRCQLQVPLRSRNGTSSTDAAFHDTACDWGYRWLWFH